MNTKRIPVIQPSIRYYFLFSLLVFSFFPFTVTAQVQPLTSDEIPQMCRGFFSVETRDAKGTIVLRDGEVIANLNTETGTLTIDGILLNKIEDFSASDFTSCMLELRRLDLSFLPRPDELKVAAWTSSPQTDPASGEAHCNCVIRKEVETYPMSEILFEARNDCNARSAISVVFEWRTSFQDRLCRDQSTSQVLSCIDYGITESQRIQAEPSYFDTLSPRPTTRFVEVLDTERWYAYSVLSINESVRFNMPNEAAAMINEFSQRRQGGGGLRAYVRYTLCG